MATKKAVAKKAAAPAAKKTATAPAKKSTTAKKMTKSDLVRFVAEKME
jgi:DNA-binding protein HU-beta